MYWYGLCVAALDDQPTAGEEGDSAIGNPLTSADVTEKDCENNTDSSPVEANVRHNCFILKLKSNPETLV